jgi:hypothetical protein
VVHVGDDQLLGVCGQVVRRGDDDVIALAPVDHAVDQQRVVPGLE